MTGWLAGALVLTVVEGSMVQLMAVGSRCVSGQRHRAVNGRGLWMCGCIQQPTLVVPSALYCYLPMLRTLTHIPPPPTQPTTPEPHQRGAEEGAYGGRRTRVHEAAAARRRHLRPRYKDWRLQRFCGAAVSAVLRCMVRWELWGRNGPPDSTQHTTQLPALGSATYSLHPLPTTRTYVRTHACTHAVRN